MIKLFRNIRQNLLIQGKTTKYFKYAIGEIILVVIGILIALQINNWNEDRKLQKEELKLLQGIKANLKATLRDFEIDTLIHNQQIQQYQKIEHYIQKDLPYTTELDSAFGLLTFWNNPYITTTAYTTLQNKGLDIIKNEPLKNDITNMYEVEFQVLLTDYDRSEWNLSENVVIPFFSKHIRRLDDESLQLARPNNFEDLKQNDEFINILTMLIRQRKRGIMFYRDTFQKATKLIEKLDDEINSRTK